MKEKILKNFSETNIFAFLFESEAHLLFEFVFIF